MGFRQGSCCSDLLQWQQYMHSTWEPLFKDHCRKSNITGLSGGGFFLTYEDFGRMFDDSSQAACALKKKFFLVEISSHTPGPLFRPGSVHSGSAE